MSDPESPPSGNSSVSSSQQANSNLNEDHSVDQDGRVHSWFSRKSYAAAFGRYEGIGPAEAPDNAALLGRDNQRARLLNLLFNVTNKGAYLVTGHRGSGKTTFVDYCLSEYRRNTYERFLKHNVGRTFLWDRLGLMMVVVVLLAAGLILHEGLLLALYYPLHRFFAALLLVFCGLLSLHPLAAAFSRIDLLVERVKKGPGSLKDNFRPHLLPALVYSTLLTGLALTFPLAKPTMAAFLLILFFAAVFFISNCYSLLSYAGSLSWSQQPKTEPPHQSRIEPPTACLGWRRVALV